MARPMSSPRSTPAALTYDAKGNLTQNVTGDTYTWDFDNQLRTATVSGAVTTLAYDALGRRVSKASGATANVYVGAAQPLVASPLAGQILAQYPSGTAPSSPSEKWVYGVYIDEPLIKVGTGGTLYYHAHDLFSVSALTDTNAAVVERYRYTAYGVLTILAPDGVTVRSVSSYANPCHLHRPRVGQRDRPLLLPGPLLLGSAGEVRQQGSDWIWVGAQCR